MNTKTLYFSYLDDLQVLNEKASLSSLNEKINSVKELVNNQKPTILIMGEFSAGKSSVINAILGKELLITRATVATSVPTYITYGSKVGYTVCYEDGRELEVDANQLKAFTVEDDRSIQNKIAKVIMRLNVDILKKVTLIDSPGLNAPNEGHKQRTLNVLEEATDVFWIMDASKQASKSELHFFDHIIADKQRFFVIVNKIDMEYEDIELPDVTEDLSEEAEDRLVIEKIEKDLAILQKRLSPFVRRLVPFSAKEHFEQTIPIFKTWATIEPILQEITNSAKSPIGSIVQSYKKLDMILDEYLEVLLDFKCDARMEHTINWIATFNEIYGTNGSVSREMEEIKGIYTETLNRIFNLQNDHPLDDKVQAMLKIDNYYRASSNPAFEQFMEVEATKKEIENKIIDLKQDEKVIKEIFDVTEKHQLQDRYHDKAILVTQMIKVFQSDVAQMESNYISSGIIEKVNGFKMYLHNDLKSLHKIEKNVYEELTLLHQEVEQIRTIQEIIQKCHELIAFNASLQPKYSEERSEFFSHFKTNNSLSHVESLLQTSDEVYIKLKNEIEDFSHESSIKVDQIDVGKMIKGIENNVYEFSSYRKKYYLRKLQPFIFPIALTMIGLVVGMGQMFFSTNDEVESAYTNEDDYYDEIDYEASFESSMLDEVDISIHDVDEPGGYIINKQNFNNQVYTLYGDRTLDDKVALLKFDYVYPVLNKEIDSYQLTPNHWVEADEIETAGFVYYPAYYPQNTDEIPIGSVEVIDERVIPVKRLMDIWAPEADESWSIEGLVRHEQTFNVYEVDTENNILRISNDDWISASSDVVAFNREIESLVLSTSLADYDEFLIIEDTLYDILVYEDESYNNIVGKLEIDKIYPIEDWEYNDFILADGYYVDGYELDKAEYFIINRFIQDDSGEESIGKVSVITEAANIRTGSSLEDDIDSIAFKGDTYDVLDIDEETGWYYLGSGAWISNKDNVTSFQPKHLSKITEISSNVDDYIGYIVLTEKDKDVVNVYDTPYGSKVGTLIEDKNYPVVAKDGYYYAVGKNRWVSESQLNEEGIKYYKKFDPYISFGQNTVGTVRVKAPGVYIRSDSEQSAEIISLAYTNEKFEVLEIDSSTGWLKISDGAWITGKSELVQYDAYE